MSESTDLEFSPQRLSELKMIAASGDEEQLAKAVTDIPSLVIEVTRLRQELFESKERIKKHLAKIAQLEGLTSAMRPEFRAQEELADLRNKVADVLATADKNERALKAKTEELAAAEDRIKGLVAGMTEMSRATGSEEAAKLIRENIDLKQQVAELRDRCARLERSSG